MNDDVIDLFLADCPGLDKANLSDNEALVDFVKSIPMDSGGIEISYDQSPDYFKLFKTQGEKSLPLRWTNKSGEIVGLGSLVLSQMMVNSKKSTVGYLGGLRLSSKMDRRQRVLWRRQYAEFIRIVTTEDSSFRCDYLVTAVLSKNEQAIRSLTNNKEFSYLPLRLYDSYSIICRFPVPKLSFSAPKAIIRNATSQDADLIKTNLKSHYDKSSFGPNMGLDDGNELERRLQSWDSFKLEDFLLVSLGKNLNRNGDKHSSGFSEESGEPIAVLCPYSSNSSRKLVIKKIPFFLKTVSTIMSWFGRPKVFESGNIEVLYVTHFVLGPIKDSGRKIELVIQILGFIVASKKFRNSHILTFIPPPCFCASELALLERKMRMRGFLFHKEQGTFYQVMCLSNKDGLEKTAARKQVGDGDVHLEALLL